MAMAMAMALLEWPSIQYRGRGRGRATSTYITAGSPSSSSSSNSSSVVAWSRLENKLRDRRIIRDRKFRYPWPGVAHCTGKEAAKRSDGKYTKMSDVLYEYMLNLMPVSQELSEVSEYTRTIPAGHMQSSPEQIKLFALLIKVLGAKRAIEVGVFTGYSALGIAQALPEDGILYALERDEKILEVAKAFWIKAGVSHKIRAIQGDAVEEMKAIVAEEEEGSFDFAFIDANKRAQLSYYEQCLSLVRRGGIIVIDNVLWYGRVVDDGRNDKITIAIRELNQLLREDRRIDLTVLPVGDGIAICLKH